MSDRMTLNRYATGFTMFCQISLEQRLNKLIAACGHG